MPWSPRKNDRRRRSVFETSVKFLFQATCLCMSKNADLKNTDLKVEQLETTFWIICVDDDSPLHTNVMEKDGLKKVRIEVDGEVTVNLSSLL